VKRVLFVTNGHGEAAIAERIAHELGSLTPSVRADHLGLVGETRHETMNEVGPRRSMPSGGLIAMGNLRNLARDFAAGLPALTWAQASFLRRARKTYDAVIGVGDTYVLMMALLVRKRTIFVGTAKSVRVAPYGPVEERILARAAVRFVRDEATARALHEHGLAMEPAANAIVDLFDVPDEAEAPGAVSGFDPALAIFPGSRESAYADAEFLLQVTAVLAARRPALGAVLSVARGLSWERFAGLAERAGWQVRAQRDESIPFVLSRDGREIVRAWNGPLGPVLRRVALVLGQAGTANEAAAAAGVPVVAFERDGGRKMRWYRRRQRGLLGDALAVLSGRLDDAVAGVERILSDPALRRRMGETGRERMGKPGAAARIAQRIASLIGEVPCGA
jgi:uncharacterized protein (TIGR03492 family)